MCGHVRFCDKLVRDGEDPRSGSGSSEVFQSSNAAVGRHPNRSVHQHPADANFLLGKADIDAGRADSGPTLHTAGLLRAKKRSSARRSPSDSIWRRAKRGRSDERRRKFSRARRSIDLIGTARHDTPLLIPIPSFTSPYQQREMDAVAAAAAAAASTGAAAAPEPATASSSNRRRRRAPGARRLPRAGLMLALAGAALAMAARGLAGGGQQSRGSWLIPAAGADNVGYEGASVRGVVLLMDQQSCAV